MSTLCNGVCTYTQLKEAKETYNRPVPSVIGMKMRKEEGKLPSITEVAKLVDS